MRALTILGIIRFGERSIRKFFEHRMTTHAAALAYRGLFGLFPFVLILVVLVGVFGLPEVFDRLLDPGASGQVPEQLEPVVEQGREQIQPLQRMIEQARERAGGELIFFGLAVALWSVSALARTSIEAFNTAYEVTESRPGWKRVTLSVAFGPVLALMASVSAGLMLIGPRLVERIAEVIGLDELVVFLWGWLRLPVALLLVAAVLSVVYRYGPDAKQRFRSVAVGSAFAVALWAITSVGFSIYLANFANYGLTYGSLGAAVGLLFYLYLSASVVLLGAEVNAAIYNPDRAKQPGCDGETADAHRRRTRDL
ncbi:MAG TPA: YihY/virulence factor BrkB family protein [Rubrobacter sp.]|nr:YihY/virulence factor BrkB family protein [Rubrobacter sp.]